MPEYAWNALRLASKRYLKGRVDLRIEGESNLPSAGPVIIAARHYHHLLDGAVLMATVPYPLHILVGLDWVRTPLLQKAMKGLCDAAGWPIVLRRDGKHEVDDQDARQALRRAYRQSLDILRRRHALLVFPEGYPTIDPTYTPKTHPHEFLPFQPGFAQIAKGADRMGIDAPVVPAGFSYRDGDRWEIVLHFGPPVRPSAFADTNGLVRHIEDAVRALSDHRDDAS